MDNTNHNSEWFCPQCGNKNYKTFCSKCGSRRPENQNNNTERINVSPHTGERPYNQNKPAKKKINFNSKKLRYILIIIIVILIGILAGILFMNNKNKFIPPSTSTPQPSEEISSSSPVEKAENTTDNKTVVEQKSSSETKPANLDYLKDKVSPNKEKQENKNVSDAGIKFFEFHRYITEHELRSAYNCLSNDFKNKMTYDGWAPGFDKTLSSNPSNLQVVSSEPNRVVFTYDLEARDKENNKVKVQNFKGTTILIKQNGSWSIDSIVADKKGEHIE